MKIIYKKIILLFISVIIGLGISCIESNAASASISASSQKVNVGDKVTITASATGCLSELSISGPGVSGSIDIVNTNLENETKTATYTLDTSSAGTKKVTMSGSVVDANKTEIPINKTVTITVAEKAQPVQQPTQQQQQQQQQPEPQKPAEPNFTNTNQTMYTTGNINLRSSWSTSSAATSVPAGTEVTVTATSNNSVNGYVWYRVSYNGQTKYVASGLLTSTKPATEEPKEEQQEQKEDQKEEQNEQQTADQISNKALKDLVVEDYKLVPDFNPETTKYSLTLKNDDEKLIIKATPENEKATVNITGNENFKIGNNIVRVTVTAQDGTTRMYTITVSKTNEEGNAEVLKLKQLLVSNASLDPSFDPDVTNYVITVDDPSLIKASDIVATAEDSDVEVTVAENTQSDNNEKVITIMLENKDGTKTGVYQITVKKQQAISISSLTEKAKDNTIYYILGGIIAVLLIFIIIIIILLKKTSNDEYDEDYGDADELSDDYDYSLKNAIDEVNENTDTEETSEMKFDEMVENSSVKSQILATDYNVFRDQDDEVGNDDDYEPDVKSKKKGKHF